MRGRAAGFTLLEAIVALTIFAAAGLALFAGMSQALRMIERAEQASLEESAWQTVLADLTRRDAGSLQRGEMEVGAYVARWRARPTEPTRQGVTGTSVPGLFDVTLLDVRVELLRGAERVGERTVRRVAYVQARQPPVI